MNRLRALTILSLLALPILFLSVTGMYYLWNSNWIFWAWFPLAGCFATAYLLGWYWQREHRIESLKAEIPEHSTNRDREAWKIVEEFAKGAPDRTRLDDSEYYFLQARSLSERVAALYYPNSKTPLGNVTLPELLTAMELASAEMRKKFEDYVPGGHLFTINNLRYAGMARAWVPRVQNAMWMGSAILDPFKTGVRYLANRYGVNKPMDQFQENLVGWFYAMFVQRVGHYLIELYSGRLKVGTEEYRKLMMEAHGIAPSDTPEVKHSPVRITLIGPVGSGKSDLVRILLHNTAIDNPTTEPLIHRLELAEITEEIRLVDTVPYTQVNETELVKYSDIWNQADLILWVVAAGRFSADDKALYANYREYFRKQPNRKAPAVIWVLTKIETLAPANEWNPPYEWQDPQLPKEHSLATAINTLQEEVEDGELLIVPAKVSEGNHWGVDDFLLPMIGLHMRDAKAVARLRDLEQKHRGERFGKVVDQLLHDGREVLGGFLSRLRSR
ncbi:GTPase domain-containing protein [Telmatocola sphagniphila]|uniref:GTPase domain-containing protein n=1 Tax=Telmatocola sphagniphila TaxID=1123043 RepID=A0A8E6BD71_9BACT|nr:GTPase domain-containing protein [Telmatocola sphagniphila]QVL34760.1 GTPase domain-containing protein [Telmatocola sphagniphila]